MDKAANSMSLLREFLALYRAHGHDGFLRRQQQPVLLHVNQHLADMQAVPIQVNFPELLREASPADIQVLPLVKRLGGAPHGGIMVGRTPDNDIYLPYNDVSKEHAYFKFHPKEGYTLTDTASRNGTAVDGKVLEKNKPIPLEDGADIAFARIHCCFMLPEGFAMLLKWVKIPE